MEIVSSHTHTHSKVTGPRRRAEYLVHARDSSFIDVNPLLLRPARIRGLILGRVTRYEYPCAMTTNESPLLAVAN